MTLQMASSYLRELLSLERETQKILLRQSNQTQKQSQRHLKGLVKAKVKEQQAS